MKLSCKFYLNADIDFVKILAFIESMILAFLYT